jgi:hypothetical protein
METQDDLAQAEEHLKQAETDLAAARNLEQAAEREVATAIHEVREVEDHRPDAHHVAVEIATTSGFYPKDHADRLPLTQPVAEELDRAAKALELTDTTAWVASVDKRVIDPKLSYVQNRLEGCVVIDWGPAEGGGGP